MFLILPVTVHMIKSKKLGYNLRLWLDKIRPSYSFEKRRACVYYEKHIPLVRRDNLCPLSICLVTEICLENEKCFLTCLLNEFENFSTNIGTLMDHINYDLPICSVIAGDHNER